MPATYCHRQLLTLLATQEGQLDRLYARKSREVASILKRYKLQSQSNVWKGNRAIEAQLEKALEGLAAEIKSFILSNATRSTGMANDCLDSMVRQYTKGIDIPGERKEAYFNRNQDALAGFISARVKGLDISSRVWQADVQTKEQIETLLRGGITEGRSAREIASDLKKYLKEPDRRFRRVRNEEGKLVLSNPAKAYHPGQGVYRSSYKNALRLSRNEINIAYRQADYLRVQELDFALGIRVNLSNAHPAGDICDELQGVYPKGFRFVGWHPQCLCFTTTVLLEPKDFVNSINNGKFDKRRNIRSIPPRAKKYLNDNAETIKGWTNKPYFIEDNFKNTEGGFALKNHVIK